jgi:23S rRNA maturation mini-RNase III
LKKRAEIWIAFLEKLKMNRNEILKRAKQAAAINKKNRKDPRYVKVMGFLD